MATLDKSSDLGWQTCFVLNAIKHTKQTTEMWIKLGLMNTNTDFRNQLIVCVCNRAQTITRLIGYDYITDFEILNKLIEIQENISFIGKMIAFFTVRQGHLDSLPRSPISILASLYVLQTALAAKFTQDESMKAALLATGDTVLGEASPTDIFFGIGLSLSNPMVTNQHKWRGNNLLGKTLMQIRTSISNDEL